jgi:hypothetical protein
MSTKARRILREVKQHGLGFDLQPVPQSTGVLSPDRPNTGRFVPIVDGHYQIRRFANLRGSGRKN